MSERDRSDRLDEDQFDAMDSEPIEGFADFEADYFEDSAFEDADPPVLTLPEDAADAEEAGDDDILELDVPPPPPPVTKRRRKPGRVISPFGLSFVYTTSILAAAIGVGGACLLVVGANPLDLWQPAQLLNLDNYVDLANNPLNVLALVLVASVVLVLLGSWAIGRATMRANRRLRLAESTLDKITALRLDREEAWQDPGFKSDPAVASFTSEVLGAWRLQSARQKRSMGLEGELHRLEKALAKNRRSDLTGRFDHPAVGGLADEMVRYFDERSAVARELEEIGKHDEAEARSIVSLIQDARSWQQATLEHVGSQGAALERVARRLQDHAAAEQSNARSSKDAGELIAEIRQELADHQPASSTPSGLDELVDKGSKLAFQIAMEVARLGPRGERLSPLAQSLEELTTDIRQLVDQMKAAETGGGSADMSRVRGKLVDLSHRLTDTDRGGDELVAEAGRTVSTADDIASNLAEIGRRFQTQADRLITLGKAFATLCGITFDPEDISEGNPDNPPEGSLLAANPDPFGRKQDKAEPEVDPFAGDEPGTFASSTPPDPDFSRQTLPDSALSESTAPPPSDPLVIDYSFGVKSVKPDDGPIEPAATVEPITDPITSGDQPDLPDQDEKVYDLDELGARAPDEAESESVHELSDFGAVGLESEPEDEPVVEMANLGAVRIDDGQDVPASEAQTTPDSSRARDRVYELTEFGAVLVT